MSFECISVSSFRYCLVPSRAAVWPAICTKTDLQMNVNWFLEPAFLLFSTGLVIQNVEAEYSQPVSVPLSRLGSTVWGP